MKNDIKSQQYMLKFLKNLALLACCIYITGCNIMNKRLAKHIVVQPQVSYNETNFITTKNDQGYITDLIDCSVTPMRYDVIEVPQIYKTNDLRKRTGYPSFAKGQFIRISGVITDNKCVPISYATVQIWHADAGGLFKAIPYSSYLYDDKMYTKQSLRFEKKYQDKADVNFTGSGSTVTNNLGRFTFFSIMPGNVKNHEPLINFRVIHKDFNDFNTIMYFPTNKSASILSKAQYKGTFKTDDVTEEVYSYNITLDSENKYLHY